MYRIDMQRVLDFGVSSLLPNRMFAQVGSDSIHNVGAEQSVKAKHKIELS